MKSAKTLKLIISGRVLSASMFLATAAMPMHSGDGKPELKEDAAVCSRCGGSGLDER